MKDPSVRIFATMPIQFFWSCFCSIPIMKSFSWYPLIRRGEQGPLAWALIVWRCSKAFSSVDKLVRVLVHLLPGLVFFTIRWWDLTFFEAMHPQGSVKRASWP